MLDELSKMDTTPNEKAAKNVAAQLAIIRGAFKESQNYPVCCFTYTQNAQILCDSNGPLTSEAFMQKCRTCQAQIKQALAVLQNA